MSYDIKRRTNGMLFVEFEDLKGKRKRVSLKTRDPAEAKVLARNVYAEQFIPKEQTREQSRAHGYTVNMAIDYLCRSVWSPERAKSASSLKSLQSDIKQLRRAFGGEAAKAITTERLQQYVEACRKRGLSYGTIDKHFGRLSRVLNACANEITDPSTGRFVIQYVPKMPALGKSERRDIVVSPAEEAVLEAACKQLGKAKRKAADYWLLQQLITWQIETGMRVGETLSMTRDWLEGDAVNIPGSVTKPGEPRIVILSERAQQVAQQVGDMDAGLFGTTLSKGKMQDMWTQVREHTGLTHIHIHDLRHTAITRWRDAGVPLDTCARLAGHKDIRMTFAVYDTPNAERLRNEMRGEVIAFPNRRRA